MRTRRAFCCICVWFLALFALYGKALVCLLQNVLFGWAAWNRLQGLPVLFLSVSLLMIARLWISTLLPFTSPAFAFLVAKSMPAQLQWAGTFFLLAGSVPAGLVLPLLDWVLWRAGPRGPRGEAEFRATRALAWCTDRTPFSFWVAPCLLQPVFQGAHLSLGLDGVSACAAAVPSARDCSRPRTEMGTQTGAPRPCHMPAGGNLPAKSPKSARFAAAHSAPTRPGGPATAMAPLRHAPSSMHAAHETRAGPFASRVTASAMASDSSASRRRRSAASSPRSAAGRCAVRSPGPAGAPSDFSGRLPKSRSSEPKCRSGAFASRDATT